VQCPPSSYPSRFLPLAVAFWDFNSCNSDNRGAGKGTLVTLTGECIPGGVEGSAWRLRGGQKLVASGLGGLSEGSTAHSVGMWVMIEAFASGNVSLVVLGTPQSAYPSQRLNQEGTFVARHSGSAQPSARVTGSTGFVGLVASDDMCAGTPRNGTNGVCVCVCVVWLWAIKRVFV
jgi:hypothetical protein